MRKLLFTLIALVGFIGSWQEVRASHFLGGEMTYQHLFDNKYLVKVVVYRDCGGVPIFGSTESIRACGSCLNQSPGPNRVANLDTNQTQEVSQLCASSISSSECSGGTLFGIEKYVYEYVATVDTNLTCPIRYVYRDFNRNNSVNIIGGSGTQLYIDVELVPDQVINNSSPQFINDPVPFYCTNQNVTYSFAATDADGDSLTYELDTARSGNNICNPPDLNYAAGFSPSQPLVGLSLNQNTGAATFNTGTTRGEFLIVVKVNEYTAGGVYKGSIFRDMKIIVDTCSNNAPSVLPDSIVNFSGTSTKIDSNLIRAQSGQTFCATYRFSDPDGDTIRFTVNGLSGFTNPTVTPTFFNVNGINDSLVLQICGQANGNLPTNNPITINVSDSACPIPGNNSASFNVEVPPNNALSVTFTRTNPSCNGADDGQLIANASGGSPPYTFIWQNLSPGASVVAPGDSIVNGLSASTPTVQVQDANSDIIFGSQAIIDPPGISFINFTATADSCGNECMGEIAPSVGGGIPPYTFLWDDPFNQTTLEADSLCSGIYSLTVTDNNACTDERPYGIQSPVVLKIIADSIENVSCNGGMDGKVGVIAGGGRAPSSSTLIYTVDTTGTYNPYALPATGFSTLPVTDVPIVANPNSVQGPFDIGFNFEFFGQAKTQFYISDNGFISFSAGQSASTGPGPLLPNPLDANDVIAWAWNDLRASSNATSRISYFNLGSAPNRILVIAFDSLVHNFGGANIPPEQSAQIILFENSNIVEIHSKFISDYGGPFSVFSTAKTQGIENSTGTQAYTYPSLNGQLVGTDTLDSAYVAFIPPQIFNFNWSTGRTTNGIPGDSIVMLTAGNYTLTITDGICSDTSMYTVTEPDPIVAAFNEFDTLVCNGDSNAAIVASVASGGTAPFTFEWNDVNSTVNDTVVDLPAGNYSVTITDANGCTQTASYTVGQPVAIGITLTPIRPTCNGDADGRVLSSVSNITGTAAFLWNTGETSSLLNNKAAGTYTLVVTDNPRGCQDSASIVLLDHPLLTTGAITGNDVTCFGGNNGSASIVPAGGFGAYTFNWTPGNITTNPATGLTSDNYEVTVTDNNGCTDSASVFIDEPNTSLTVNLAVTDLDCNGDNSGTATATTLGGTGALTFAWTPAAANSASINGLAAGPISVTVTDANMCTGDDADIITEPAPLLADTSSLLDVTCNGDADGAATINARGGTSPYSFTWPGSVVTLNDSVRINLSASSYVVTVTDDNNCPATTPSIVISQPNAINVTVNLDSAVKCNGDANGGLTATAVGGNPGAYTFSWNPPLGATTASVANLAGNTTYQVTVFDSRGCSGTGSRLMTDPVALSNTFNPVNNPSCQGGSNGSITSVPAGGTVAGAYTFQWSANAGSVTTALASNLTAGTYTVTITDDNGCTFTDQQILTDPLTGPTVTVTPVDVICFGDADGQAIATIGGTFTNPVSYTWSSGQSGVGVTAVSGLDTGVFSVTITDNLGCTATDSDRIDQPNALVADTSSMDTAVACFGDADGAATINATGGTSPYSFAWATGISLLNDSSRTNLSAGTYNIEVTDDNGCTVNAPTIVVTQPLPLIFSFNIDSLPKCNGDANGGLTANVIGGTAPFTFNWIPAQPNSNVITGLDSNNYRLTVTDARNCSFNSQILLDDPDPVSNTFSNVNNPLCQGANNGSLTANPTGGTVAGAYTFQWSANAGGATSGVLTGLTADTYLVTITDDNGCSVTDQQTLTDPPNGPSVSITTVDVNCFGDADGQAIATLGGTFTNPVSYTWSSGQSGIGVSVVTGLDTGVISVTITDANSCTASDTNRIDQPDALALDTSGMDTVLNCFGDADGTATINASGGTSPYSFAWNTGISIIHDSSRTTLSAGTYNIVVTDDEGCTATAPSIIVISPLPLIFSFNIDSLPKCNGDANGGLTANVVGGTAPFTFNWTPAQPNSNVITGLDSNTYALTVIDSRNCSFNSQITLDDPDPVTNSFSNVNGPSCQGASDGTITANPAGGTVAGAYTFQWSPNAGGATNGVLTGLTAGTYIVTITDDNGCTLVDQQIITDPANGPIVTITPVNATCFGQMNGQAIATLGGNFANPVSYSWSNGQNGVGLTAIGGLDTGVFSVTITDANGCTDGDSSRIDQPDALVIDTSAMDTAVACFGDANGTATFNVTGGSSPYSFAWVTGTSVLNDSSRTNLSAGTYNIVVTDDNGCASNAPTITVTQPLPLIFAFVIDSLPKCDGDANGGITVNTVGGNAPFSYNWDPAQPDTNVIVGLDSGLYQLTITDAEGCDFNSQITLSDPDPLTVAMSKTNISCTSIGQNDGSVTAAPAGGTTNYTFLWSPNAGSATTSTVNSLTAATYTVTITDANGCTTSSSIDVDPSTSTTAMITDSVDVLCNGASTGSASATLIGGTPPLTWTWNAGGATSDSTNTGLTAGTYTVTISDNGGCQDITSVTIEEESPITILIGNQTDALCNGDTSGTAMLNVSGGVGPYLFLWPDSAAPVLNDSINTRLRATTYVVTITDQNGCTQTSPTITISEPTPGLDVTITLDSAIKCFGDANGGLTAVGSGGTPGIPGYQFFWAPPGSQVTPSITGLDSGLYGVAILDGNGCIDTASFRLDYPDSLDLTMSKTNVSCNSVTQDDGTATVSVTGGTGTMTFSWNTGATTASISNLVAATYTVTATDANGCSKIGSVSVDPPASTIAQITGSTNVACFGGNTGTASATLVGGTPPLTWSWNAGGATSDSTNTGLTAGTYSVTVSDAGGCQDSASITITEPASGLSVNTSGVTNALCFGDTNGQATVNVLGGTAPYSYEWVTASGSTLDDSVRINLSAATYIVTVTDGNGCTQTTAPIVIGEPTQIVVTINLDSNIKCFGGNDGGLSASAAGGAGGFNFAWSTGLPGAAQAGLDSGLYTVIVTDANGCQDSASQRLDYPDSLTLTMSRTNVTCGSLTMDDGTASVAVTGGTGAGSYTFLWNNGGTNASISNLVAGNYTITVTDANGCSNTNSIVVDPPTATMAMITGSTPVICAGDFNGTISATLQGGLAPLTWTWSSGGAPTDSTNTGLFAGTYSVTVSGSGGCSDSTSFTLTQPLGIIYDTIDVFDATCAGVSDGQASVVAFGGVYPYSYQWPGMPAPVAGDSTRNNLGAGTYVVTLTDANGCTQSSPLITIIESGVIGAGITVDSTINCFGGTDGGLTATATGGAAPLTSLWMPGGLNGASITGLDSGLYEVFITDANGCIDSAEQQLGYPDSLSLAMSKTNITCNSVTANDGSATVVVTGGTPGILGYTYTWSNGVSSQLSTSIGGLTAGTYTVTVTDGNGCSKVNSITVDPASATVAQIISSADVTCNGGSDGEATATLVGGTAPLTFTWSHSALDQPSFNNLTAGTYSVTVADGGGCSDSTSITINEPTAISAIATTGPTLNCFGDNNGTAFVSAAGGTSPFSFQWPGMALPVLNDSNRTNLTAGAYQVTVVDDEGCQQLANFDITGPDSLAPNLSVDTALGCLGANDGAIVANVTGGTAAYTYAWSTNVTSINNDSIAFNLGTGFYEVTITDGNGCVNSDTLTLEPGNNISIAFNFSNQSCMLPPAPNGGARAIPTGGSTPYTYLWSNGFPTDTIFGLLPGNYKVTVTDAGGCTGVDSVDILPPGNVVVDFINVQNVSCNGLSDGAATPILIGGVAPFTYVWSDNLIPTTNATRTGLPADTFFVGILDGSGCLDTGMLVITEPDTFGIVVTSTDTLNCNGNTDGIGRLAVTGGTRPYSFTWPGGTAVLNDSARTNLSAGTYTVTLTDANGCNEQATFTIEEPAVLAGSAAITQAITCFAAADGELTASATGGSAPYTFAWSNGQTGSVISNLDTGTYTVIVTDARGCTDDVDIILTQPDSISANLLAVNISCNALTIVDGKVFANPTGGTQPYTYQWSNAGSTVDSITGLATGTYTVTITDANGCFKIDAATVLPATATDAQVIDSANIACSGDATGFIRVALVGGLAPFTYTWTPAAPNNDSIGGLVAGTYKAVIQDAGGCIDSVTVTLSEPATPLVASIASSNNATCFGIDDGAITAQATGGAPNYTFNWSANAGGAITPSITGLSGGTYSVTVTDAGGCTDSTSITIEQPQAVSINFTNLQDVSCFGLSDGQATANGVGGTGQLTFAWSNGTNAQTNLGLTAATYTVVVTDAQGCSNEDSVTITEPTQIDPGFVITNVTCASATQDDGTITINATGGSGSNYTFAWDNGTALASRTGLAAGTYTVTITDGAGCNVVETATVGGSNSTNAIIVATQNLNCAGTNDGFIIAELQGGTAPFTFNWSNGQNGVGLDSIGGLAAGTYTVTISDAGGCIDSVTQNLTQPATGPVVTITNSQSPTSSVSNDGFAKATATGGNMPYTFAWSNSGTTDSISGLGAGNYCVTVTDGSGCTSVDCVTLTNPGPLALTVQGFDIFCNGDTNGMAVALATGGTPPYTYGWSNGQTTDTIRNLTANTYSVTLTDAAGTTLTGSTVISEPTVISMTLVNQTDPTCAGSNDGTIAVSATGGTLPYTFAWSNGQSNPIATGLAGGTYTLVLTDAAGCIDSVTTTLNAPAAGVTITTSTTNVTCSGAGTGTATANITSGTGPFTFAWSDGQSSATALSLNAGSYTVVVTDNGGCTAIGSANITEPAAIAANLASTNLSCGGTCDGKIVTNPTGGTAPYTFAWSNGGSLDSITGLCAASYTLVITDANGCTASFNSTLTEPTPIAVTAVVQNSGCGPVCNGAALLSVAGGSAPYTYNWPSGNTLPADNGLCTGITPVTVSDANGCSTTFNVIVNDSNGPDVSNITSTGVSCFGNTDGSVTVVPTGATTPYTFAWNTAPVQTTAATTSTLAPGQYFVTVTGANGCSSIGQDSVREPDAITLNFSKTEPSCFGGSDGEIIATVSGGTTPYTYAWNNGISIDTNTGLDTGTYCVTITDANGCTTAACETLTQPDSVMANASVISAPNCAGNCDGQANVAPVGGTAPYASILWSDPAATTSATVSNLCAGTYGVRVEDINGCFSIDSVTIVDPVGMTLTTSIANAINCSGSCDGEAAVSVAGGNAPYTYAWSDPAATAADTARNLCAGQYFVTVTDAGGCTMLDSITLTSSSAITLAVNATDATCGQNDGSAIITATGGTPIYSYQWPGSATPIASDSQRLTLPAGIYTVVVVDASGCIGSVAIPISEIGGADVNLDSVDISCFGSNDGIAFVANANGNAPFTYSWTGTTPVVTNDSLTGLSAGLYTLQTVDASLCIAIDTVRVNEPDSLILNFSVDSVACTGDCNGVARALAANGTAPYTYAWSTGGSLDSVTGLCSGTYTLTLTDANGCSKVGSITLSSPLAVTMQIVVNNTTCGNTCDGVASAGVIGGTAPFTYNWPSGPSSFSVDSNICGGNYILTVTDGNGCTSTEPFTISGPPVITANISSTMPSCHLPNGVISANVNGGTFPYTLTWDSAGNAIGAGNSVSGIFSGIYNLNVTDSIGCTADFPIILSDSGAPLINGLVNDVSCNGGSNGAIDVTLSGGTPAYTFSWNTSSVLEDINGLTAGLYTINVLDNNGCNSLDTFRVNEPDAIVIDSMVVRDLSCEGADDGQIGVFATGGVGILNYGWADTTGQTFGGQIITPLPIGRYIVTISDGNGCTVVDSSDVTSPGTMQLTAVVTNTSCVNTNDGAIDLTVIGGTAPLTYNWNNSGGFFADTADINNLTVDVYVVTVTDDNGCLAGQSFSVEPENEIEAVAAGDTTLCGELDSLTLFGQVAGAGNSVWYDSLGNIVSTDLNYTLLPPTGKSRWILEATAGSCVSRDTVDISFDTIPDANAGVSVQILSGTTYGLGGSPSAQLGSSITWSPVTGLDDPSLANPQATPDSTTLYTLTVTNPSGCTNTDTVLVSVRANIEVNSGFSPNGDGTNDFWNTGLELTYPDASILVFNRWGQVIFQTEKFANRWDGTYNGETLPIGTYYYVIELNDDSQEEAITGPVTIVR